MKHCGKGTGWVGGLEGERIREEENKRKKLNWDGKSRELREMPLRFALQHLWGWNISQASDCGSIPTFSPFFRTVTAKGVGLSLAASRLVYHSRWLDSQAPEPCLFHAHCDPPCNQSRQASQQHRQTRQYSGLHFKHIRLLYPNPPFTQQNRLQPWECKHR